MRQAYAKRLGFGKVALPAFWLSLSLSPLCCCTNRVDSDARSRSGASSSAHATPDDDQIPYRVYPKHLWWDYEDRLLHNQVFCEIQAGGYWLTLPVGASEVRLSVRDDADVALPGDVVDYGNMWRMFSAFGKYIPGGDDCGIVSGQGRRAWDFDLGSITVQRLNELSSIPTEATRGAHWLYCPLAGPPLRIIVRLGVFDGIERWSPDLLARFEAIDPKRYCLDIGASMVDSKVAPLPAGIECLMIERGIDKTRKDDDYLFQVNDALRPLRNLRYLEVSNAYSVDMSIIANNSALELLDVRSGTTITNVGALRKLHKLRSLQLLDYREPIDLEFLADLRNLRFLDLTRVKAKSLRPIENLPHLVDVYADESDVLQLPQRYMPKLRTVHVMSTSLPRREVERFAKLNPHVKFWHSWNDTLPQLLRGITRMKIGDIEVTDVEDIRQFKQLIQAFEGRVGWDCRCDGQPWFELFRGEERAGTISLYHGVAIRWREQWPSGAFLGYERSRLLVDWLESHWITEPKKERQKYFESWPPE